MCPSHHNQYLCFSFFSALLILLFSWNSLADAGALMSIGAMVDCGSRIGKEERVAMEMAVDDFYSSTGSKGTLVFSNSTGDPLQTALHAMELINQHQVQSIVGLRNWEHAVTVAELGNKAHVPILSFAEAAPTWAMEKWPFLVQATHNQQAQMRAVSAIVGSWGWRRVSVIYEEPDFIGSPGSIITHLTNSLREVGSEIDHWLPIPSFSSPPYLSQELVKLQRRQCRVFVVHLPFHLASSLFAEAKRIGMMEKDYVWISTSGAMNLVHSADTSTISSMQGVLGVKSYFSKTGERFKDFSFKFRTRFRAQYPEEENSEPGVFGLQAYDAVWAVANAMKEAKTTDALGRNFLERILTSNFDGLSGKFHFVNGQLVPACVFKVVNVIGRSYRNVGYWVEGSGFLDDIDKVKIQSFSMRDLGQVIWPGAPWVVPRGWALPTAEKPLRIGVPANATFSEFVNVKHDGSTREPSVTGFSIDVFKATLDCLPYHLEHKFIPYDGNYDSLVQQVHLKNFDAVVGDVTILADRYQHVEFSQPYLDSGLVLVVPVKSKVSTGAWLFMKPFTKAMWGLVGAINMYNAFVVLLIERRHNPQLKGSVWNQIGALFWLTFSTLFSWHGDRLNSNLSRMVMLVWLLLALVVTSSYTANLSSMLTVQRLEPTIMSVETLRKSNAKVGCSKKSFVSKYLHEVLDFFPKNIKNVTSEEDYFQFLKTGVISAAFLEEPYAKVFLAKHCKEYTALRPTYKVGGFGFVFPRGSPMLVDISKAVQKVSESGKLLQLENALISSCNCTKEESDDGQPLSVDSFWGLFVISGGISTVSLTIFLFQLFYKKLLLGGLKWTILAFERTMELILTVMKNKKKMNNQHLSIDVEGQDEHAPNIEELHTSAPVEGCSDQVLDIVCSHRDERNSSF